jgi:hypothetical protein
LWLDTDKLHDILESSDDPQNPAASEQQQQQPEIEPENRVRSSDELGPEDVESTERDIEEESPSTVFSSEVRLKLKEESEDGGVRRRR